MIPWREPCQVNEWKGVEGSPLVEAWWYLSLVEVLLIGMSNWQLLFSTHVR